MRSSDSARTHRTSGRGRIRAIEFGRAPAEAPTLGYARYVGRVGALAIALGVGSAVASMPMAFADTTGSAGSSADNSSTGATKSTSPSRRSGHGASAPASDSAGSPASPRSGGSTPAAAAPRRNNSAPVSAPSPAVGDSIDTTPDSTPARSVVADTPAESATPTHNDAPAPSTPADEVASVAAAPSPAAAAPRATASASVNTLGSNLLSWLATSGNGDGPAVAPLMWTALAVTRREDGDARCSDHQWCDRLGRCRLAAGCHHPDLHR